MKVRNILIGLLVVLMAFVFISCEDEPEPQPQPTPTQEVVYTLSTKNSVGEDYYGNDKPRLVFDDLINDGDTLSFQFRSERDVYQFDIRNGNGKWVYQQDSSALTSYEVGDDGWITVTYTFGSTWYDGSAVSYGENGQEGFDVRFRGRYFKGDLFEVKNVKINDTIIPLKEGDTEGFTLKGFELAAADAIFSNAKSYAVVYSVARAGDDDKAPLMEKVASGAKPVAANLEKEGFELEIFTQYDDKNKTQTGYVEESKITLAQLKDMVIEKDTIIYLKYTGVPRTVTFKIGEDLYDQKVVAHGYVATKPETDPTKEGGYQFAAWCSDSGLTTEVNLAETPITADTTFYAKFNKVWNVSFSMNGKPGTAPDTQVIIDGQTATKPEPDPKTSGFRFKNWKLASAVFDFTTAIEEDIELVAEWEEAETVNFTYYTNDGTDDSSVVPTFVGEPATSTKPEDPERAGFVFLGWFDAAEGGTEYAFTEDVTVAKSLYAHWAKVFAKMTVADGRGMDGQQKSENEKFQFNIDLRDVMGEDAGIQSGDVLSFKFRSSRDIYDYDIRTNKKAIPSSDNIDIRWVYEGSGDTTHLIVSDPVDGWITVTYTFGTVVERDRIKPDKTEIKRNIDPEYTGPDYANEQYYNIGLNLRGYLLEGDVLEIKDVSLTRGLVKNDIPLKSAYNAKTSLLSYEDVQEHDWAIAKTFAVVYAEAELVYNGSYHVEAVAENGYATGMSGTGYTYYSDSGKTSEFNIATTPITEDTIIYYTLAE